MHRCCEGHDALLRKWISQIPHALTAFRLGNRYLKAQKGRGGDTAVVYEWGANAEDEIGRSAVNDFIKEVIVQAAGCDCAAVDMQCAASLSDYS